jgi:hypothetical protein
MLIRVRRQRQLENSLKYVNRQEKTFLENVTPYGFSFETFIEE